MQKRATNRGPPPIRVSPETAAPSWTTPELESQSREKWRKNLSVGFNSVTAIETFRPSDSLESCERIFVVVRRMEAACGQGDLEDLRVVLHAIRTAEDSILNRPTSWEFWDCFPRHFEKAYKHNHWHIIDYLVEQPEFHIIPPKSCSGTWQGLPAAISEHSLSDGRTDDLQHLRSIGWDMDRSGPYTSILGCSPLPPTLW
jgi:hypothetical protein